jgi:hypothetical protein
MAEGWIMGKGKEERTNGREIPRNGRAFSKIASLWEITLRIVWKIVTDVSATAFILDAGDQLRQYFAPEYY